MANREVVLIEDGIAVGLASRAAIKCCRKLGARRVAIATPIASPDAVICLEPVADDVNDVNGKPQRPYPNGCVGARVSGIAEF